MFKDISTFRPRMSSVEAGEEGHVHFLCQLAEITFVHAPVVEFFPREDLCCVRRGEERGGRTIPSVRRVTFRMMLEG